MPKQIAYPEIRDWYKAGLDSNNKNLYIFWVQYNNAESYDTKNDNKLKKALPKNSIFLAGRPPLAPLSSGTDSVWGRAKDSGKDWGRDMGREKDKESGRAKVSESGRARVNVSVRARERGVGGGGGRPEFKIQALGDPEAGLGLNLCHKTTVRKWFSVRHTSTQIGF